MSPDISALQIWKNEENRNRIENLVVLNDILRIFVPSNTQKLLKSKKPKEINDGKGIEHNIYEIFVILKKNDRVHLVTNDSLLAERLICSINILLFNRVKLQNLMKHVVCFCVLNQEGK